MPSIWRISAARNTGTRFWLIAKRKIHRVRLSISLTCSEKLVLANLMSFTRTRCSPRSMPKREQNEGRNRSELSKQRFLFGSLSALSVSSWSNFLAFQLVKEPGARMGPVVIGGAGGD